MLDFSQDDAAAELTCRFSGELRTNECMALQEKVALQVTTFLSDVRKSEQDPVIIFDLKDVTFASSFFVRIVLSCVQRVGKENVKIVHTNEFLTGLFRTVGLSELLRPA